MTLIETVVSIAVIAVLLGVMLPGLRDARFVADLTVTLANQQATYATLTSYMHDHAERFPSYGAPGTHEAVLTWDNRQIDDRYWGQPRFWGLYLHTLGYDGWATLGPDAHARSYELIRDDSDCASCGPGFASLHVLTNSVFAEPAFWTESTEPHKSHHRVMRGTHVANPAAKALVVMRSYGDPKNPVSRTLMHFGDGHGEVVRFVDLRPGVVRGGVDYSGWAGFSTERGVQGRDR